MRKGLLIAALFLPNFTATYEQTLSGENDDIALQIARINSDIDKMERRLESTDALVGSWETLKERQEQIKIYAGRMRGDTASSFLQREKKCLEKGCKRTLKYTKAVAGTNHKQDNPWQ